MDLKKADFGWIVATDRLYYPDVREFDTEEEARTYYDSISDRGDEIKYIARVVDHNVHVRVDDDDD